MSKQRSVECLACGGTKRKNFNLCYRCHYLGGNGSGLAAALSAQRAREKNATVGSSHKAIMEARQRPLRGAMVDKSLSPYELRTQIFMVGARVASRN
jgi:hypothetical protein